MKYALGEIQLSKDKALEFIAIRKDGSQFNYELSLSSFSVKGKWNGVGILRDITNRLKTEEELKKSKENLQDINLDLEQKIEERTLQLTSAKTQLLRLQKENLQSQFEMLKNQVNPHFLFNSLNVLVSLIKLEPDTAEKFTEQLSKVYRYVLENKEKDLVSLETELNFLNAYVYLLEIRFKDKLKITFHLPEDKLSMLLPPIALQLLIENAIKHNTFSKKNPLQIDIHTDEDDYLHVINNLQIRDSRIESTGVGLKNIETRYGYLTDKKITYGIVNDDFEAKIPLL
jgi:LytS/YehU family sensor histidine kinase